MVAVAEILLQLVGVRLAVNFVVLRSSRFIHHDTPEHLGVLALEMPDNLLCLLWVQIHGGIIGLLGRGRKAKEDFGIGACVVYELDPLVEADVRVGSTIRVIKVGAGGTNLSIVELDEEEVKIRVLDRLGEMGIGNNALRRT